MNELKLINNNGQFLADSRDVAEMTGKRHDHLLRDIDGYVEILGKSTSPSLGTLMNEEFRSSDFFIPGTYSDGKGETRRNYLITRKGCDMVANKLTGEKGVLFTAAYVTKFDEMEQQRIDIARLSPELQLFNSMFQAVAKTQLDLAEVKTTVQVIQETFLQRDEDWRKHVNGLLTKAAFRMGGKYQDLWNESYRQLEERGRCNLNVRLNKLLTRLAESGATKTKIAQTSRMDVIEADPKLKEIYTTIVKELSIGSNLKLVSGGSQS
ncbi:Rha family transcriptional regulator [Paenibacillus contaminans]|uniref:Rha family transcriptional regulator n=1 Tax=Paenibacillus contaminans TaxID=450362 RepID=A0A329MU31_9BACL|nr:Rha family transcriptional regulator [Paenibacillus contaminans]RAV22223.1 Rha family transcriptional regulator [Paenibacillus contaminans]